MSQRRVVFLIPKDPRSLNYNKHCNGAFAKFLSPDGTVLTVMIKVSPKVEQIYQEHPYNVNSTGKGTREKNVIKNYMDNMRECMLQKPQSTLVP